MVILQGVKTLSLQKKILQNGKAAQTRYKMAVPNPPCPQQTLGKLCQHFFGTKKTESYCHLVDRILAS